MRSGHEISVSHGRDAARGGCTVGPHAARWDVGTYGVASSGHDLAQARQQLGGGLDLRLADRDALDVHAERYALLACVLPRLGEDALAEPQRCGERIGR